MQHYFQFAPLEAKGDKIAVLAGGDHFILVLTAQRGRRSIPTLLIFISALYATVKRITALYEQLIANGYTIPRAPAKIRNSFAFYFHIPGSMAKISCTL